MFFRLSAHLAEVIKMFKVDEQVQNHLIQDLIENIRFFFFSILGIAEIFFF